MDLEKVFLCNFEVPESLDLQGSLHYPGPDDLNKLDASEANNQETWTKSEIEGAIDMITDATSKNMCDCIYILKKDVFDAAFSLMRQFPSLEKAQQISVSQSFSLLCKRAKGMVDKIPLNPHFSGRDALNNEYYMELQDKILSSVKPVHVSGCEDYLESPLIDPHSMGLILRSLLNVCAFLSCTCYKLATTVPSNDSGEKKSLFLDISRSKKAKKAGAVKKKGQHDFSNINKLALELLVDSICIITKVNMSIPFSGEKSDRGHPSFPFLRLLLQTLLLSLDSSVAHSMSSKLIEALSKIMEIYFDMMKPSLKGLKIEAKGTEGQDSEESTKVTKKEPSNSDYEWLTMLTYQIQKKGYGIIAESLELLRETAIPNFLMNELLLSVKENFLLHATNHSAQLMSSTVQSELSNVGNLTELRQLFDLPSYALRKSIMEAIKSLIIISKSEFLRISEGETDEEGETVELAKGKGDYMGDSVRACARQRDDLLQLIFSRKNDSYMYARVSVLKILRELVEAEVLPIQWYKMSVSVGLSRLMDKASQVRKRALSLLAVIAHDSIRKKFLLPLDTGILTRELDLINSQLGKLDALATTSSSDVLNKLSGSKGSSEAFSEDERQKIDGAESESHKAASAVVLRQLSEKFGHGVGMNDKNTSINLKNKLELAREMYSDVLEIAEKIELSVKIAEELLRSPTEIDQRAAIKYIAHCHLLEISSATTILSSVWKLSWANNQNVVDSVLNEFRNVYFADSDDNTTATRLIRFVSGIRLTCLASIEKIFEVNITKETPYLEKLDRLIIALLRFAVAPNQQLGRNFTPRVALGIVRLILWSCRKGKTLRAEAIRTFDDKKVLAIRNLLQLALEVDLSIFGELCVVLTNVSSSVLIEKTAEFVFKLFMGTIGSMDDRWFRMSQCVVDLTFVHCKNAENLWYSGISTILANFSVLIPSNDGEGHIPKQKQITLRYLSQIIFLCGHIALRMIITMDKLQADLKRARAEFEALDGNYQNSTSGNLGLVTRDEEEREIFEQLCENDIVCNNLLGGPIRNLIVFCLHDPCSFISGGFDGGYVWEKRNFNFKLRIKKDSLEKVEREVHILKVSSAITICKYATVSKRFCNSLFLPGYSECSVIEVIISLLLNKRIDPCAELSEPKGSKHRYYYSKEPISPKLRSTLLISYGDLLCRHPNLLEPWNDEVCQLLLDKNGIVRETAVLVFTHLVMNDMVKPKGKLLDSMMFLTLDRQTKISDCAKTFFHEIHKKNPNTIYNCFPEMIATLAKNKRNQSIAKIISILNMLFNFIRKEKQHESIVEKVCIRLRSASSDDRTAIAVYTSTLLRVNYDERCIAMLIQSLNFFRHLIIESDLVLAAILAICRKVKSSHLAKGKAPVATQSVMGDESIVPSTESKVSEVKSTNFPGENTSIKDMAEDLIQKLHALFGEDKSPHVIKIAANADNIIEELEQDTNSDENEGDVSLYIEDFGCVNNNAGEFSDEEQQAMGDMIDSDASSSGIKLESTEKASAIHLKVEESSQTRGVRHTQDNIANTDAIEQYPLTNGTSFSVREGKIIRMKPKAAIRRKGDFYFSDDEDSEEHGRPHKRKYGKEKKQRT